MGESLTGLEVRRRRKALGLWQRELAAHAGIDPANLGKMERGQRPIGALMADVLERTLTRLETTKGKP